MTNLFPGAQCGIGPATDEGFFYDFIVPPSVRAGGSGNDRAEDAGVRAGRLSSTSVRLPARGRQGVFAARGEPLKVQLIDEKAAGQRDVSATPARTGRSSTSCVGPHVPSTGKLKAFNSSARRTPIGRATRTTRRCSGSTGPRSCATRTQGAPHTDEEAKKRDHRKLGRELGLFAFHQGRRARILARQGTTLTTRSRLLRDVFIPRRLRRGENAAHLQQGAVGAGRPWKHYRENMFLIEPELNVPAGAASMVRRAAGRQWSGRERRHPERQTDECRDISSPSRVRPTVYRDLPSAFTSRRLSTRNEASGVLSGLTPRSAVLSGRCPLLRHPEQSATRSSASLPCQRVYRDFDLRSRRSCRPCPRSTWARSPPGQAEPTAKRARARRIEFTINPKGTAPSTAQDRLRRHRRDRPKWQCATIQLDYMQAENFDLKYTGATTPTSAVVIHRAYFRSFERFIAI